MFSGNLSQPLIQQGHNKLIKRLHYGQSPRIVTIMHRALVFVQGDQLGGCQVGGGVLLNCALVNQGGKWSQGPPSQVLVQLRWHLTQATRGCAFEVFC